MENEKEKKHDQKEPKSYTKLQKVQQKVFQKTNKTEEKNQYLDGRRNVSTKALFF